MCLIAFAWQAHPRLDLVVAANRDEFHARSTAPAHWWHEPAGLFAGRDLKAGGAWCGMDRLGRFAAVTNVRNAGNVRAAASRGLLVRDYFAGTHDAAAWAEYAHDEGEAYGPFNLLVGDRHNLWFVSNRGAVRQLHLRPGVHAISNGHWGDHWPKTEYAQNSLAAMLARDEAEPAELFDLLADNVPAPMAELPDTGVGTAYERFLSPLFIRSRIYGTRASTVIRRDRSGVVEFHETGFDARARPRQHIDEHWTIDQDE